MERFVKKTKKKQKQKNASLQQGKGVRKSVVSTSFREGLFGEDEAAKRGPSPASSPQQTPTERSADETWHRARSRSGDLQGSSGSSGILAPSPRRL